MGAGSYWYESISEATANNFNLRDGDIIDLPRHGKYAIIKVQERGRTLLKQWLVTEKAE